MISDDVLKNTRAFLLAPENTVTRERMFFARLCFELKLAAAHCKYDLEIFEPEVDRRGFDVILDDHDLEKRFQLKTIVEGAKTSSWEVHKRLLRPTYNDGEQARWSPMQCGLGGGLLVIDISLDDPRQELSYRYLDWYTLNAFAEGLIGRRDSDYIDFRKDAYRLICELAGGSARERISIPQRFLLKPRSTDHLLALAGFHNCVGAYQPFGNFMKLFKNNARISEDGMDLDIKDIQLAAALAHSASEVLNIIDDSQFRGFEIPAALKGQP